MDSRELQPAIGADRLRRPLTFTLGRTGNHIAHRLLSTEALFVLQFTYILLAVCIGAVCGAGSGYMARAKEQVASTLKLWVVWAAVIAIVLLCAKGIGTINVAIRPSEEIKFLSVAALAIAFFSSLVYTRRKK